MKSQTAIFKMEREILLKTFPEGFKERKEVNWNRTCIQNVKGFKELPQGILYDARLVLPSWLMLHKQGIKHCQS